MAAIRYNKGRDDEGLVWNESQWLDFEDAIRAQARRAESENRAWENIVRASRRIMSVYTTSFYIVSRFLPRSKRQRVEVIYAAVRFPDEVVDSFSLSRIEREERLDRWTEGYEKGLTASTLRDALEAGVSPFLAAFTRMVKQAGIPHEHYRSFLAAMRRDIHPMPFQTLEDLIDSYIYGSAIVVGCFLAHVYGAATPGLFDQALESSRNLAIGLQLTNFLRDVKEDQRRGRLYLPLDMIRAADASPEP